MEAKKYVVGVSVGNADVRPRKAPTVAVFTVDEALARYILKQAGFVKENDLSQVKKYDYRVAWLQHNPATDPREARKAGDENMVRTESDTLCVTGYDFQYKAWAENGSARLTTESQSLQELAAHFGLPFGEEKQ